MENSKKSNIVQLTHSAHGHTLHHNGVFSKDGQWIVFDGRNEDTKIGETATIGVVNINTGEEKIIYQTKAQTQYGPGVGAASFSPTADRVIFIHGLLNANKEKPYGFTRRTGVAIDLQHPFQPIFMDARDIAAPYTPGSLRGGTHSHCWSPDGQLISFTYNDEFAEPDLRTVGIMVDVGRSVITDTMDGNNNGEYYAAIITDVVANPAPGSDEIGKAFDECWVGEKGPANAGNGLRPYTIAFQGNTKNPKGEIVTEIYVVDIDTSLILADTSAIGRDGERPHVPKGIHMRRITHTEKGLSQVRHWLRSSPDGKYIYAFAEDKNGITQVIQCEVNTGKTDFLTNNTFSIKNPFNVSPDGSLIAFIGDNNVYLFDIHNRATNIVTDFQSTDGSLTGAPCFSPDGKTIAFNQYIMDKDGTQYLQILSARL